MKLYETTNLISNWIKKYAETNSLNNLIVGVSGGIDSALTSTLCAKTGLKTIIVSMPIHQKKTEINNVQIHYKWLVEKHQNVQLEIIELTNSFENFKSSIPTKFHSELSLANTRARLRMTTLYQIAGSNNGLVVGTGNKIEDFGIGFFTKYGDGGVDISPIADLTKSEVKELAQFCGISEDILNTPPTDGLWLDGRTDEDQIGASYEELEWAMNYTGNQNLTARQKIVFDIYQKRNKQNKHKMKPIPICNIPDDLRN